MKAHIPIERYLETIKKFQEQFPTAHVGGSIGLFIHGIDLQRPLTQSDIDMTIDDYLPEEIKIDNYVESSNHGDFDGNFRCHITDGLYIKMEIRVNPEPSFEIINHNGISYNVSKKRDILFWKTKYAKNGAQKHINDLVVINGGVRPEPQIPVDNFDELPF